MIRHFNRATRSVTWMLKFKANETSEIAAVVCYTLVQSYYVTFSVAKMTGSHQT